MNILKETIKCHRTLELIHKSLKVDSIFNGRTLKYTGKGTPQGSVLSPLLANIVLDKFDKFMEDYISKFNKGKIRAVNKVYHRLSQRRYKSKDPIKRKELLNLQRITTRLDYNDPNFRRMFYTRYADDFVVLIISSFKEAHEIRNNIKEFLSTLGLELNLEKTPIVKTTDGFKFLGASCLRTKEKVFVTSKNNITSRVHRRLIINADMDKLIYTLEKNKFVHFDKFNVAKATSRKDLINLSHFTILSFYNNKIRGLLNYYSFAGNYPSIRRIIWLLVQSCALTLTLKYKSGTMRKMFVRFGKTLKDPETELELYIPKDVYESFT
jgi:Type II intron maturase/Reverse transcriptase (RNA-dependent DNA polymerase)